MLPSSSQTYYGTYSSGNVGTDVCSSSSKPILQSNSMLYNKIVVKQ